MRNDPIIAAILNFLVPIIFLYGMFCFVGFFEKGFFNVIYSITLFVSGFIIISAKFSALRLFSALQLEFVSFFVLLLSICYFVGILISVTDLFAV
jgi:hypothetical protein